jgi:splicing factor 3A subunit 1
MNIIRFFLNLVDAYTKCLNPKRDDIDRLLTYVQDKSVIYQHCIERYEFENF